LDDAVKRPPNLQPNSISLAMLQANQFSKSEKVVYNRLGLALDILGEWRIVVAALHWTPGSAEV